jgi:hypothetical protein
MATASMSSNATLRSHLCGRHLQQQSVRPGGYRQRRADGAHVRGAFRLGEGGGEGGGGGVDRVIVETMDQLAEALLKVCVVREAGTPAVVTMALSAGMAVRECGIPVEAMLALNASGTPVVGINRARRPETVLPILRGICATMPGPIAALHVPYRTTAERPTFQSL